MDKNLLVGGLLIVLIIFAIFIMARHDKKKYEIKVQTRPNLEKEVDKRKIEHSSGLATFLQVVGVLTFIGGLLLLAILMFDAGVTAIISSLLLFAIAEIVYHVQLQSKILLKILNKDVD
jgi:hypothetical protein